MGHRCKNQQLRVIVVHNDEELDPGEEEPGVELDEQAEENDKAVMCRLNTIVGLTTPGMIKI